MADDKVDILLVDDQPAKLLSYEVILRDLGENLIKATSAREALEVLLKRDIAVVLIDVCMPELDGFQLAAMIREHPRFRQTAIIFISAIHLSDVDRLRGYEMGAADYVPVPVIPEVLRPGGDIRWCVGSAAANTGPDGRITRVSGVIIDITDRKEAEERQSLLAREVDHRARNALAVVQAIIRLTRAKTVDGYVEAVEGRIRALSRAHMLLSHARWQGADLGRLVDEELGPYRTGETGRITVTGPDLVLHPATAQTLALALHELATNAAKHGALSSNAGRVQFAWELKAGSLAL